MRTPATISTQNLFQIQRYIPRTWRRRTDQDSKESPTDSLVDSIRSLSAGGRLASAFAAFSSLRRRRRSSFTLLFLLRSLSYLLSCCSVLRALPQGRQLHAHAVTLGLLHNRCLVARLTAFYASLNVFADAHVIAETSASRNPLHWNLLLSAYTQAGSFRKAILAYRQLVKKNVRADRFTYSSVLRACGEVLDLCLGREIHRRILSCGLELDLVVWNALVAVYAKCGALDAARKLFEGMRDRDVVSWNSMISGYASRGMWEEAFGLLDRMQAEGVEVNTVTWNAIIDANLQLGKPNDALQLISQMRRSKSEVDCVTLMLCLDACSRIKSLRLGKVIHALAVHFQCSDIENVRNALMTMYSRCGHNRCACTLFQMTDFQSLVSWNAMISGFAIQDRVEEAYTVFRKMIRSVVQPNDVTMLSILSLCARVADLHHGQVVHCFVVKHGYESSQSLCNSLIDLYSKCGMLLAAQRVFDMMSRCDKISYTTLIAGYGMQGDGSTALQLFDVMIQSGIRPDHVTMVAVLSACSHSGLVSRGEELFSKMVRVYGVVPRLEHFSCMVDLYCRAGALRKAEEIIDRKAFQPSNAMLATLVAACLAHGNLEIGLRAAKKLLAKRPEDPNHYILIARMYEKAC